MKFIALLIQVVLPALTLINITAAFPTSAYGGKKYDGNTAVAINVGHDRNNTANPPTQVTCYGEYDDTQMLGPWPGPLYGPADPVVIGGLLYTCLQAIQNSTCKDAAWCVLGAIAICGIVSLGAACMLSQCYKSSGAVTEVLTDGRQTTRTVYGTAPSTRALADLERGMIAAGESLTSGSLTSQYRNTNGQLEEGTFVTQDAINRIRGMFQICECSGPRCQLPYSMIQRGTSCSSGSLRLSQVLSLSAESSRLRLTLAWTFSPRPPMSNHWKTTKTKALH